MYRICWNIIGFLAAILPACASPSPAHRNPRSRPVTRLRPIHIVDYEAAMGLQRRTSEDFSDLNLQTQSEIIYGSPGDNGQLLLANMTLYAPNSLMIIMMERFEGLTSSVDCKGDEGMMSLTFSSQGSFNYALQEWAYVNENDDGLFLLIANHDGCGPDDKRQPYLLVYPNPFYVIEKVIAEVLSISKITEDTATLTTYLTAQTAPWSDIAGTYDLDFGQAIPYQKPQQIKERSLWGDIENVGKDVLNTAEGNVDISKSVTFDVSVGQQGQPTNIYNDPEGHLTLDCINCFVTGSFEVTGHLSVHNFDLQDLTLTASPQNFEAGLVLEATVTSSDEPNSLQYTKELFSFPIPDAGIEVEGIFKLGAILSYDVGVSSSFQGSATVGFGLQASLPNSAQLTADIQNPDQSSATGFGGGQLTPLFDIKQESASITLAAFSQPKLVFGIELIDVGKIDVAISLKLPEVSVTLTAAYDEAGVCSQTPGSSQTGVKLDSEVDIAIDLEIDASLGDDEDTSKPSWSKTLFEISKPLGSMCFPLSIPGLRGTVNATSVPALPLASQPAAVSSGAALSSPASGSLPAETGANSISASATGGYVSASASLGPSSSQLSGFPDTLPVPLTAGATGPLGGLSGSFSVPVATGTPSIFPTAFEAASSASGSGAASSAFTSPLANPPNSLSGSILGTGTTSLDPANVNGPSLTSSSAVSTDLTLLSRLPSLGSNPIDLVSLPSVPTSPSSATASNVALAPGAADDGIKAAIVHPKPSSSSGERSVTSSSVASSSTSSSTTSSIISPIIQPSPTSPTDNTGAATIHSKSTTSSTIKTTTFSPNPTTPTTILISSPQAAKEAAQPPTLEHTPPPPPNKEKPTLAPKTSTTTPAPSIPTTISSAEAQSTSSSTPDTGGGGGGCRMVRRRVGKRMLVC